MKKILFFLLLGLALSSLHGQDETFRRYYGTPYAFADEDAFTAVSSGDRMAMIGVRENRASQSTDLAVWFFDPVTGAALDSVVVASSGDVDIADVYPGPDGGFLIIHTPQFSGLESDITFSYFNASGEILWEQFIPEEEFDFGFEGIRDLSFSGPTDLIFSVYSNGSGDRTFNHLVRLNSVEGITELSLADDLLFDNVWSIEQQLNGDLLIAGTSSFDVFVALLDSNGVEQWRTEFENLGGDNYEYLSDAHWPAGKDYILATGRVSGGRGVIIFDTLGNSVDQYNLDDFPFITEKEQVSWFGRGDTLFVNDNSRQFSVLHINFDDGTSFTQAASGSAAGYRVQGGYYDLANNQVITALDNTDNEDVAIARSPVNELEVNITDAGISGNNASEFAVGISPSDDGGFFLQTGLRRSFSLSTISLAKTDAEGNIDTNMVIVTAATQQPSDIFQRADDGNFLAYDLGIVRASVKKFTPEGTDLWSVPLSRGFEVLNRVLVPLPNDRFALTEYTVEQLPDFSVAPFSTTRIGNSSGTVSDTLVTTKIGFMDGAYSGHENDLLITGTNLRVDSARVIKMDLTSGEEVWEYNSGALNTPDAVFADVVALESGHYGLLLSAKTRDASNPMNLMEFVRLDSDGQEISRYNIPGLTHFIYSPQSDVKGDTVMLAFGVSSADEDNLPIDHGIRVYRFLASTGEVLLDEVFPAYFGTAMPAGISSLADGRTALLATTPSSDTSSSDDILLLVFDAEGRITNLSSVSPLSVEVTLSPNPTPNLLQVQVKGADSEPLDLYLFDVSGRIVKQAIFSGTDIRQTTIDLSNQSAGTYWVMLRDRQGRMVTRQVVKQ